MSEAQELAQENERLKEQLAAMDRLLDMWLSSARVSATIDQHPVDGWRRTRLVNAWDATVKFLDGELEP